MGTSNCGAQFKVVRRADLMRLSSHESDLGKKCVTWKIPKFWQGAQKLSKLLKVLQQALMRVTLTHTFPHAPSHSHALLMPNAGSPSCTTLIIPQCLHVSSLGARRRPGWWGVLWLWRGVMSVYWEEAASWGAYAEALLPILLPQTCLGQSWQLVGERSAPKCNGQTERVTLKYSSSSRLNVLTY